MNPPKSRYPIWSEKIIDMLQMKSSNFPMIFRFPKNKPMSKQENSPFCFTLIEMISIFTVIAFCHQFFVFLFTLKTCRGNFLKNIYLYHATRARLLSYFFSYQMRAPEPNKWKMLWRWFGFFLCWCLPFSNSLLTLGQDLVFTTAVNRWPL